MAGQRVALTSSPPFVKNRRRTATATRIGALESTTAGRSSTMTTSC